MNKYVIILCLLSVVAGFIIGRLTVKVKEKIEYVESVPITGSVSLSQLEPDTVFIPIPGQPIFVPMKADTVILPGEIRYISQVPDTAAVFNDYIAKKDYSLNLLNEDEKGKIDVNLSLQYNALQSLDYNFTPVAKVITREKERVFQPFVSSGWSTIEHVSIGAGMFIRNIGFEYQYLKGYNSTSNGHSIGIKFKF